MKICVAQSKAVIGDIEKNISNHRKMAEAAVLHRVDMIIFPELSLTGYEPTLANALATNKDDERLNSLQQLSDDKNIIIGAGIPIRSDKGILISMIIFQPHQSRQTYFKQYLHADEEPYFINGQYQKVLNEVNEKLALAICYEISVPEHAEQSYKNGANIYIASVAKTISGVSKAMDTLSDIAKKYSMTVLLSNCVGECEGKEAGGRSSVWNNKGILLEQLNDIDEGMIIFDTKTQEVFKEQKNILYTDIMSKDQTKDILKFLKPFEKEVIERVLWLREFVWDLYPQTNELIYDNYNAIAVGWSPTDRVGHTFCSIAVGRTSKNVHFGFYWGTQISDPNKILLGEGNQYRYILVPDKNKFPKAYIKKLVKEAYANSLAKVKDKKQIMNGQTIVKSISAKKREKKSKPVKTKKK